MISEISENIQFNTPHSFDDYLRNVLVGHVELHISKIEFVLNSSVVHSLSTNLSAACTIASVTIISSSESHAVIECDNSAHRQTGFVFSECTVEIQSVAFVGCGFPLVNMRLDLIQAINSSLFKYSADHATILLCIGCTRFDLINVTFNSSVGFSAITINLASGGFQSIIVADNKNTLSGSGVLLHFNDAAVQSTVGLNDLNFHNIVSSSAVMHDNIISSTADGLTVLFIESNQPVNVVITKATFSRISGTSILIFHYNTMTSFVSVTNVLFDGSASSNNAINAGAASLRVYWQYTVSGDNPVTPVTINDVSFLNHSGLHQPLAIKVDKSLFTITIHLVNVSFSNNVLSNCMDVADLHGRLNLCIENMVAVNNGMSMYSDSVLRLSHVANVSFFGNSRFDRNLGSVIYGWNTKIHLYDKLLFKNNVGYSGAGIKAMGRSVIHLHSKLSAVFDGNYALVSGGAIFTQTSSLKSPPPCAFQADSVVRPLLSFTQNVAFISGSAVYAQPIYNCTLHDGNDSPTKASEIQQLMVFGLPSSHPSAQQNLSTIASYIQVSLDGGFKNGSDSLRRFFPGEKISLNIKSLDARERFVHSTVLVYFMSPIGDKVWLGNASSYYYYQFDVRENEVGLTIETEIHTNKRGLFNTSIVFVSEVDSSVQTKVDIGFQECPFIYKMDNLSGSCICSQFLFNSPFANVFCQTQSPSRYPSLSQVSYSSLSQESHSSLSQVSHRSSLSQESHPPSLSRGWFGWKQKEFTYSNYCSCHYCNCLFHIQRYQINESDLTPANIGTRLPPVCIEGREGALCGRCEGDKGLVFGSSKCMKCSPYWLFSIPLYLVIGLLIMLFLYYCQVTLSVGVFNCIIFFTQLSHAGLLDVLDYVTLYSTHRTLARLSEACGIMVDIMGLEINSIGLPVCFSAKMTQVVKTGLLLTYPIYMLLVILTISQVTKRWVWLSNKLSSSSVQIIVTIAHLSFSKLLLLIIDVFAYTTIYTEHGRKETVWYFDGTQKYMEGHHLVLVIVSIIVSAPLILSYFFLLLFTKKLLKHSAIANKYLRPLYEAIHAPYKSTGECFFTFRFLLLVTVYIVYASNRSSNPAAIFLSTTILLTTFIVFQVYFKPFKSNAVTIVDSFVMFVQLLTYFTAWYYMTPNPTDNMAITCIVEVFLVFGIFVTIFTLHVLKTRDLCLSTRELLYRLIKRIHSRFETKARQESLQYVHICSTDDFYGPCEEYREPALSGDHID